MQQQNLALRHYRNAFSLKCTICFYMHYFWGHFVAVPLCGNLGGKAVM